MKKNNMVVIITFYNAEQYIERCINTVITQKYDNYKVVIIDDASTDKSWDILPHDNEKCVCIKNEHNVKALQNIHNAIMNHCEKDDIVVLLDGDDMLSTKNAFSYINDYYNENDCWVMYGQAMWTNGQRGFASQYTKEEFENLRKTNFKVSHIRTFRAGIYHAIKEQDNDFSCMKDKDSLWYKMTYDVAIMFPIMEIAGYDKVKYNDKVLYVYNFENPMSEHRVDQNLQWDIHREISNKSKFKVIEKY